MKRSKPGNHKDKGMTVYIGNLNYKRDEKGIKYLFSEFGKVKSIEMIIDKKTEKKKGFAFVKMYRSQDALNAIEELNGTVIDGRTLKVSQAIESNNSENESQKNLSPANETESESYKPKKLKLKTSAKKEKVKKPAKQKQGLNALLSYLKKN